MKVRPHTIPIEECFKMFEYEKTQYRLALQFCNFIYDQGESRHGFRFMWKRKNKKGDWVHLCHRAQARIPSLLIVHELTSQAIKEGWGNLSEINHSIERGSHASQYE